MTLFVCTVGTVAGGENYTLFNSAGDVITNPSCVYDVLGTYGDETVLMTPIYEYNCASGLTPNAENNGCDAKQYEPYVGYYIDLTTGNSVGCPVGYYCPGSGYVVSGINNQTNCNNANDAGLEWKNNKCYIKDTDITVHVTSESLCNDTSKVRFEWISGECKFFLSQNVNNNQYICDEGGTVDTQDGKAIGLCKCPEGTTTTDDTSYGKGKNASDVAQCLFYTCNPGEKLKVENGVASCQPCDENNYCVGGAYDIAHAANSMKPCPTKVYANSETTPEGSFRCAYSCPAGKAMLVIGDWYRADTDCAPCPEGVYCPGEDGNPKTYFAPTVYDEDNNNNLSEFSFGIKYLGTESCPEGEKTLGFENDSADACRASFTCAPGNYLDVSKIGVEEDPCMPCENDYYCPGGTYSAVNDGEVDGKVGMYKCQQYFVRQERAEHAGWDTVFNPKYPDEESMFYNLSVPTADHSACTCPDGFEWKSETQTCCADRQFCCPRGKEIYIAKNGTKMCQTCSNKDLGEGTVLNDNDVQYYCPGSIIYIPWSCTPGENEYYDGSCQACGVGAKPVVPSQAGQIATSCECDPALMGNSNDPNLNVYGHSSLAGTGELVHHWDRNNNVCVLNTYGVGVYYTEIYSNGVFKNRHGTGAWNTDYYWYRNYKFTDNAFTVDHAPTPSSMEGVAFAGWCRGESFCCEAGYKVVTTSHQTKCEACATGDTSEECSGAAYVAPAGCAVGYKLVDQFGHKSCVECGESENGSAECSGAGYVPIEQTLTVDPKNAYDRTYTTVYLQKIENNYECAQGYYLNVFKIGTEQQCSKCEPGYWCPGSTSEQPLTVSYIGKNKCRRGKYNELEGQFSESACLECTDLVLDGRKWSNLTTEGEATPSALMCGYYCEAGKYAADGTWICDQTCTTNPNTNTENQYINPDGSSYCPGGGWDSYGWRKKFYAAAGQGRYPCPKGLTADDGAKQCYKICTKEAQYVQKQSSGEYMCKYCDGNVPSNEPNKGTYYYCPYKDTKLNLTVSYTNILVHENQTGKLGCGSYQKSDEPAAECYDDFTGGVWKDDFGNVGECWANAYCPGGQTSGMVLCPLGSVSEPGAGDVQDCKCLSDVDLAEGETPKYRPDGVYAEKGASLYEVSKDRYVCMNTYLVVDNDYYYEHPGSDGAVGPANARVVSCRWGSDSQTEGKYDDCTDKAMRICYDTTWNNDILDSSKKSADILEMLASAFGSSVTDVYNNMTKLAQQNVRDIEVLGDCAVLECPINYSHPVFDNEEYTELTSLNQCHAKVEFYANNGEITDPIHTYLVQYMTDVSEYTIPATEFPIEGSEEYPQLKKTGYKIFDWYRTATPTMGEDIAVKADIDEFSGDTQLYASWTPITYSVVFDGNGNTVIGSMDAESFEYDEEKALTENVFEKIGYNFVDWCSMLNPETNKCTDEAVHYTDKQLVANLTDEDNSIITIYANWTPITYTVTFNGNAATSGETEDQQFDYDEEKALTANGFTKIGYDFNGWCDAWNTEANACATNANSYSDEQVVSNLTTTDNSTITMFAKWNPITYSIIYNGMDDAQVSADPITGAPRVNLTTYTVEDDVTVYNAADTDDYEFLGWCEGAENLTCSDPQKDVNWSAGDKTDDLVFTAQWKAVACPEGFPNKNAEDTEISKCYARITYAGMEGAVLPFNPENPTERLTNPDRYYANTVLPIVLNNPEKDYYDFAGWYENGVAVTEIPSGSTGNKTYLATWTPVEYTITYHGVDSEDVKWQADPENEGSYLTNPDKYTVESNIKLYNPSRDLYAFVGWCDDENLTLNCTTEKIIPTGSFGAKNFWAKWTLNTYTVKFDANATDATTTKADVSCTYGVACNIANNDEITRTDYAFVGWLTQPNGTTIEYTDSITQNTILPDGTLTLYALWTPVCNTAKHLHVGDNADMCLYAGKRTTPSLVIMIDDVKYYANMCKASECDKTMAKGSESKLHIMYNDEVYNVYDLTAQ